MIERIPFRTEHIAALDCHRTVCLPDDASLYAQVSCSAETIVVDDRPVACFGAAPDDEGAQIWMLTGVDCGPGPMLNLTRYSREWFASLPRGRLEALVYVDFPEAKRWMSMLGFSLVGAIDETLLEYRRANG